MVKVLVNLGIVTIAWWAVGQGVNGPGNSLFGNDGFLYHAGQDVAGTVVGNVEIGYMLFGLFSAPSRWRSSGAPPWSGSGSAPT